MEPHARQLLNQSILAFAKALTLCTSGPVAEAERIRSKPPLFRPRQQATCRQHGPLGRWIGGGEPVAEPRWISLGAPW